MAGRSPSRGANLVDRYPYHGGRFNLLIRESYGTSARSAPREFYEWMGRAYRASSCRAPGQTGESLAAALASEHRAFSRIRDRSKRANEEIRLAAWVHGFIRSQFYYYRGERVEGGVLAMSKTPQGLEKAARNLRISVELCPRNPLSVYMLGRACLAQGSADEARACLERANALYEKFGWVPAGAVEYLDLARKPAAGSAKS